MSKHLKRKNRLIERIRRARALRRTKKALNSADFLNEYCTRTDCRVCPFRRVGHESGRPEEYCELCSNHPNHWGI